VGEIQVAAGVIVRDGRLLLARRAPGEARAGRWELPGGKAENGETLEDCLARELAEELGIVVEVGEALASARHGGVEVTAFHVRRFVGSMEARVHDELCWVEPAEEGRFDLLEPDRPILRALQALWPEIRDGEVRDGE
jgi:8-oxo-dGTP diphosphatase